MNPPANDDGAGIRRAWRLVGLVGFLVSAGILTGTWAGIKLDGYFEAGGGLTALGILAGIAGGTGLAGWLLLREARDSGRDNHRP